MRDRPLSRGFTLVEALLASVILAMAVVALAASLGAGHMASYEADEGRRATGLAEELAEYVLALPYYDPQGHTTPGPEADEGSVAAYDNADDFDGYVDPEGPLRGLKGDPYPTEYQVFRRSVSAQYGVVAVGGLGGVQGLRVVVEVRDARGRTWQVTRFIAEPID